MNKVTPAALKLARWLLAQEAEYKNGSEEVTADAAERVLDKMRTHLSKLVGVAGFQSLLARALALSRAEVVWLEAVGVQRDGAIEGLNEAAQRQSAEDAVSGCASLLAHLLGLLISFIGENLTLRLILDVWTEASLDALKSDAEDTPE